MNDLTNFLNWYFGERTRIKRKAFNIILFLAFIPPLFIQMNQGLEVVSEKSESYASITTALKSIASGGSDLDIYDIEGTLNKAEKTREATRDLMEMFEDEEHAGTEKPISLTSALSFIIFLGLIPIVQMRLRDMGKYGVHIWVFTGLIYASVVLDAMDNLLHITFSGSLVSVAGILTFILLSWVCVAKTNIPKIAHTKADNYMPGDSKEDPY